MKEIKPIKIVFEAVQSCPISLQFEYDFKCENALWENNEEDMVVSLKCSIGHENCNKIELEPKYFGVYNLY